MKMQRSFPTYPCELLVPIVADPVAYEAWVGQRPYDRIARERGHARHFYVGHGKRRRRYPAR